MTDAGVNAVASVGGSLISAVANQLSSDLAYKRQKELNKLKYEDMISYARQFGATPTSIIQGITGHAGGTVPTVSQGSNPAHDIGQAFSSGVSADAAQKSAVAAEHQSQAALTNAETERQIALMRLTFEPAKYFADIKKSLADAMEATKHAFLHGSMSDYYKELTTDIRQVRPWKIAGLRQGLLNDMATFDKIVQETKTSKAQEGYFRSAAYAAQTQGDMNKAATEKTWSEAWNEHLRGFRIQWENTLLSYGIDPNKPFWDNTSRLMYTNPGLFKDRMNMFITTLNGVDERLQENLGQHYKRNAALGYGLYKLNQIHQKNANARAYRFGMYGNTISSFIPLTGGSMPLQPTAGVDWWFKD